MNTLTFLALKLAEQSAEVSNTAEHIAEHHHGAPDSLCMPSLVEELVEFAALIQVCQDNGLFARPSREQLLAARERVRVELAKEAMIDMMQGKLTGDLAL